MSIEDRIERGKCLKELSTFGIGGKARFFLSVHTLEEMQEAARYIKQNALPFWVLGKGSNVLFDDRGFDGLVILNKIDFFHFEEGRVEVGAGYSFSLLGAKTAKKGWSGLEFASGIPGTVGGAIYMNAGANGFETQDSLASVTYVDGAGNVMKKSKDALTFSYRFSSFQKMDVMIVAGEFQLRKRGRAREEQLEIIEYRTRTQPYGEKSAGCVFRNPDDIAAGALIEQCGLKGKKVGGAEVSTKHGNFIVNRGSATAEDVMELIALVKEEIKKQTGRDLEMEVRPVPYQRKRDGIDVSG